MAHLPLRADPAAWYISAIAPYDEGVVVERILLDLRTSPGMNGSPVFDAATGRVIGIHDAGSELITAFAIPLDQKTVDSIAAGHQSATPDQPPEIALTPVIHRRRS
jgi:hypothetical protein